MKFLGKFVHVTKGWQGGDNSPAQKSLVSPQKSPVLPRGHLHDITRKADSIAAVSFDVDSGTKHSPSLRHRQS